MIVPGQLLFFKNDVYSWFRLYVAVVGETVTYVDYDNYKMFRIDARQRFDVEHTERVWANKVTKFE